MLKRNLSEVYFGGQTFDIQKNPDYVKYLEPIISKLKKSSKLVFKKSTGVVLSLKGNLKTGIKNYNSAVAKDKEIIISTSSKKEIQSFLQSFHNPIFVTKNGEFPLSQLDKSPFTIGSKKDTHKKTECSEICSLIACKLMSIGNGEVLNNENQFKKILKTYVSSAVYKLYETNYWKSAKIQAKLLVDSLYFDSSINYTFVMRDNADIKKMYQTAIKLIKKTGLKYSYDDWNPADMWAYRSVSDITNLSEINNIIKYNETVNLLIKEKKLLPISLKLIKGDTGKCTKILMNSTNNLYLRGISSIDLSSSLNNLIIYSNGSNNDKFGVRLGYKRNKNSAIIDAEGRMKNAGVQLGGINKGIYLKYMNDYTNGVIDGIQNLGNDEEKKRKIIEKYITIFTNVKSKFGNKLKIKDNTGRNAFHNISEIESVNHWLSLNNVDISRGLVMISNLYAIYYMFTNGHINNYFYDMFLYSQKITEIGTDYLKLY